MIRWRNYKDSDNDTDIGAFLDSEEEDIELPKDFDEEPHVTLVLTGKSHEDFLSAFVDTGCDNVGEFTHKLISSVKMLGIIRKSGMKVSDYLDFLGTTSPNGIKN